MIRVTVAPGQILDSRFQIQREVGRGGMGIVWAATRIDDGTRVALKTLNTAVSGNAAARRRALREARAGMALRHPNVIDVHEVFEIGDPMGNSDAAFPVLVMELLDGETLAARLRARGQLSLAETASLFVPVSSALERAHARGVIHRDLKPENLFVVRRADGTETPKVLDFGVAKFHGPDWQRSASITARGRPVGTPRYLAPEQLLPNREVGTPADVWALGVSLYECLSGIRPIEGDSPDEVFDSVIDGAITPLECVALTVPSDVSSLVGHMLRREPLQRPSAVEVRLVLERHTDVRVAESPTHGGSASGDSDEDDEEAPVAIRRPY